MEKKMKYPYISTEMNNLLFYDKDTAMLIGDESNSFSHGFKITMDESELENKTREYLASTYGEVVSPEHAEFIIELAESAGYSLNIEYQTGGFFFIAENKFGFASKEFCSDGAKRIIIPLPPKADKQESSEWPQIGDEVTWGRKLVKGEVKALSDDLAWIKNEYGSYCNEYIGSLVKPKTPEEELRDDIQSIIFRRHAELVTSTDNRNTLVDMSKHATEILLDEFEIKRKPQ